MTEQIKGLLIFNKPFILLEIIAFVVAVVSYYSI